MVLNRKMFEFRETCAVVCFVVLFDVNLEITFPKNGRGQSFVRGGILEHSNGK